VTAYLVAGPNSKATNGFDIKVDFRIGEIASNRSANLSSARGVSGGRAAIAI